mmetsp:Transcript_53758/g.173625  ORF Transcript_53758/g.173625 Transcript_53758/m.173625 type:complete len:263 (-) Transcript_53758:369-1157(-)
MCGRRPEQQACRAMQHLLANPDVARSAHFRLQFWPQVGNAVLEDRLLHSSCARNCTLRRCSSDRCFFLARGCRRRRPIHDGPALDVCDLCGSGGLARRLVHAKADPHAFLQKGLASFCHDKILARDVELLTFGHRLGPLHACVDLYEAEACVVKSSHSAGDEKVAQGSGTSHILGWVYRAPTRKSNACGEPLSSIASQAEFHPHSCDQHGPLVARRDLRPMREHTLATTVRPDHSVAALRREPLNAALHAHLCTAAPRRRRA